MNNAEGEKAAIRQALYANVALGHMEVYLDEDSQECFRMTDAGREYVEQMGDTPRTSEAS